MKLLSDHPVSHKRVLLRVDFNVSLNPDYSIADDTRIKQALPVIVPQNIMLQFAPFPD